MIGDSNYLFRTLSTCLHGHQLNLMAPQVSMAQYLSQQAETAGPEDRYILRQHAADIACDGVCAGEDILLAAANFLQHNIQVCISTGASSPVLYTPQIHPS